MSSGPTFGPSALATPANALTGIRLVIAPILIVLLMVSGRSWLLLGLWFLVAATDLADGWVARRQGTTTSGAFLDPLADKVLVLGALGALVFRSILPLLPVLLIAFREIAMSVYRSVVGRKGRSVPAKPLGKAKAWVQDAVVVLALVPGFGGTLPHAILVVLLWLAVAITLVSGAQYWLAHR